MSAFAGVERVGCGFVGHFVVQAMVLEKDECSPLTWKHSQVFAVTLVPNVSEAESELEARLYSLMAVVETLQWLVASLAVVWTGVELVEPNVVDFGPGFALEPKNSLSAVHALEVAGAMMVGVEPGQVLVPMDSNWLEAALEVVLGLLASTVAELGLELVMGAMH